MTFQTRENSEDNREETNRKDLENEIRSTWLERRDIFQLFPEFEIDGKELERRIFDIKQILDESSEPA